ncbi:MAG: protein kinase, partial [Myxococcota bacterium]
VLHRDLKPANILVEPSKTTAQPPTLKVADFGISRQAREGKVQTRDLSLTPLYAAPEQHAGVALSFSADIYALGGVLGYLATAEGPKVEHLFGDEYIELVELIGQMRAYAPDKRPDLDAIEKSLVSIADNTEPEPWPQPSSLDLTPAIPLASPSKPAPMPHQAPTLMPASTMMPEDVFSKTPPPFKTHPTPPHRTRRWIPLLSGFSAVAVASVLGMSWYITTAPAPETSTEPSPETLPETLPETSTEPSPEPIPEPKPIDSVPLALPGPDPTPPPSPKPVVKPAPTSRPNPETASTRTATVQIISKPQSEIFIDGVSKGRTRVNGTRVTVSAGSHTIRLETEDGRRWQGRYKLDTDAPHRLCYFFDSQIEKCWK